MRLSELETFGLTPSEIKVYVSLLKIGTAKAGDVIKATGLQSSVVHFSLNSLISKGIVSFSRRGQVRLFQPSDPRQLLHILDEKKRAVEALVPELLSYTKGASPQEAEIYEGLPGLRTMSYKLIEDAAPGDEFLFFAFRCSNSEHEEAVYKFYREYTDDRMRRGLVIKGIAKKGIEDRFLENRWPHHNVLIVDFPTLECISICNNRMIMVPWDDRQVSFLITSRQATNNLRNYFYSVWNSGKGHLLKATKSAVAVPSS